MPLVLARASLDDLSFIMATERLPGYATLVGRWDEDAHRMAFADPAYRYFRADVDDAPTGFVLVQGWAAASRVCLIKRVAVARPGHGIGPAMVSAVLDRIFADTDAYRVSIGCFPDNLRARKAYDRAGFVAEGISRSSAYFHGEHRDELVLAILRPEWQARAAFH